MIAQIKAVLLASATAAVFVVRRASSCASHGRRVSASGVMGGSRRAGGVGSGTVLDRRDRVLTQPHEMRVDFEGETQRYVPDLAEMLNDGSVRLTEFKDDKRRIDADPLYAMKLDLARFAYAEVGIEFRIEDGKDLDQPKVVRRNLDLLEATAWLGARACRLALGF